MRCSRTAKEIALCCRLTEAGRNRACGRRWQPDRMCAALPRPPRRPCAGVGLTERHRRRVPGRQSGRVKHATSIRRLPDGRLRGKLPSRLFCRVTCGWFGRAGNNRPTCMLRCFNVSIGGSTGRLTSAWQNWSVKGSVGNIALSSPATNAFVSLFRRGPFATWSGRRGSQSPRPGPCSDGL